MLLPPERGYASEAFIKAYMTSAVAADMDKELHHIQWAGKAYILSRMENELVDFLTKDGEVHDKEAAVLDGLYLPLLALLHRRKQPGYL